VIQQSLEFSNVSPVDPRQRWGAEHLRLAIDAARVARSLKRLAPRAGPEALTVIVEEADGTRRVVYGDPP
jgi:hypothetical protein